MILYLSSTGGRCCGRILFHAKLRLDINVMSIMIVILLRNLRMFFDPNLILIFLQNRLHRRITVIFRRYLLSKMTRLRCNHFALVSVMAFRAGAFDFFSLGAAAAAGLGAVVLFNEKRGGLSLALVLELARDENLGFFGAMVATSTHLRGWLLTFLSADGGTSGQRGEGGSLCRFECVLAVVVACRCGSLVDLA